MATATLPAAGGMQGPGAVESGADDTTAYYLEPVTLEESDDDGDYEYESVPVEDEDEDEAGDGVDTDEENLDAALRTLRKQQSSATLAGQGEALTATIERRPETTIDFIINFLVEKKLHRALEAFQAEVYEKQQAGEMIQADDVPDVYVELERKESLIQESKEQVAKYKAIAENATSTWDKFRKERDHHRMNHKRTVQEKNKLINDIKRLKKHYATYEPAMQELRRKYEAAMKDKMLTKIDRDRLLARMQVIDPQAVEDVMGSRAGSSARRSKNATPDHAASATGGGKSKASPEQRQGAAAAAAAAGPAGKTRRPVEKSVQRKAEDTPMPSEDAANPYASLVFDAPPVETIGLAHTIKVHSEAVSCIAMHPKKPVLATVSDDASWKLWTVPEGELILSGEGHKSWISGCHFHPAGSHLATASGDMTVKVWDFETTRCAVTFTDHSQAVWSCAWHYTGSFLVSGSMDHTAKLWDVTSERCRQTFRGHVDSVNHVGFQPFTSTIVTCSGDKTVSLWDMRSGLCVQTFFGHSNACNHAEFSLNATTLASTDADGVVKLWDVRTSSEIACYDAGPYPANMCSFDASGTWLAVASDAGTLRAWNVTTHKGVEIKGAEDSVQAVLFDKQSGMLLSAGNDCSVRVYR